MLRAGAATCYLGGLTAVGFLYHGYAPRASCSLNIAWITVTLVLAAVYTSISVSPWRSPNAGLLTSGAVFLYSVYLVWAALTSEPANACSGSPSAKALQVGLRPESRGRSPRVPTRGRWNDYVVRALGLALGSLAVHSGMTGL